MNTLFKNIGLAALLSLFLLPALCMAADEPQEQWQTLKEIYFENKTILEDADDWLVIEAPKRAEDAAIVPIHLYSKKPQTASSYIKNLHVFIDNNPMPYSANFHLSPVLETVDISTRMRVDQYTYIRAIAEMNDGSLHMVKRFVKASGGCSAPAAKDQVAAMARLGKMQIRYRDGDSDEAKPVQVVISHPNNSGLQMDLKTRGYIPAHYVEKMQVTLDDKVLMTIDTGISISEDPSMRFMLPAGKAGHGLLKAEVTDNKKQIYTIEKQI